MKLPKMTRGFRREFLTNLFEAVMIFLMFLQHQYGAAAGLSIVFILIDGVNGWLARDNLDAMTKLAEEGNAGWKKAIEEWQQERKPAQVAFTMLQREYNIPSTN